MNHELKRCGAGHLNAASRAHFTGKNFDLLENVSASDHRKLTSTVDSGGSLHQIRKDWDDAQKRIQDDNFDRK